MTKYFCDRCGKEAKEFLLNKIYSLYGQGQIINNDFGEICKDCRDKLKKWINPKGVKQCTK